MTEAMEGDIYSQEQIAELYMEGKGVERMNKNRQNGIKSTGLLHRRGTKRRWRKQIEVALFYLEGKGVKKDDRESIRWYEKAAQQNDAELKKH